ncbi:NAD(P)/FAD-dependent oxidoreductase [Leisingera daeponensis]|uniref:NAD(P)/FAD-dependent oxidoreductase n=1 Tax=Leisingera daeponensis TaxID=405746 RepID=UPI001C96498E|nr:FAD-dependent oxidoreductase [Leisingera daeponensis]MBY6057997.1 FAD-dependent oxidoreductase [Leisingera daeponensis]
MSTHGAIIAGAGQAGCSAAVKLRNLGYDRPITLIGDEPHPPYQRPPLSKAYLLGDLPRERLFLRPEAYYREYQITLRLNEPVTGISAASRTIGCGTETLPYDHLILATGAAPRRLPGELGGRLPGTYTIRSMADIDAIAPEFEPGRRLVIAGGGYIGLEVAAVAAKLNLEVTLIEAAPRILQRVAAPETAAFFRELHRSNGVRILEDTQLARVTGSGRATGVELAGGEVIAADFVVFGIGVTPETSLAAKAGLAVENGICTDARGRSSDPHIWAAGDCASLPYRGSRIRLESVGNAIDQAEVIAANIAGIPTVYDPKPWFWSDQYDVKLQIAGLNAGYDSTVTRAAPDGGVSVWYYRENTLIAADAMNDPRAYMIAKRLIDAGKSASPDLMGDPGSDLRTLLKT